LMQCLTLAKPYIDEIEDNNLRIRALEYFNAHAKDYSYLFREQLQLGIWTADYADYPDCADENHSKWSRLSRYLRMLIEVWMQGRKILHPNMAVGLCVLICGVNSPPSLGAVDSPQSTAMRSENIHLHPLLASKINSGNIGKKRIFARKSWAVNWLLAVSWLR
jgi:hypothetical protein